MTVEVTDLVSSMAGSVFKFDYEARLSFCYLLISVCAADCLLGSLLSAFIVFFGTAMVDLRLDEG